METVGPPLTGPSGLVLPLSQAVSVGDLVFLSGQIALRDGKIVGRDVAKTTIWLARPDDFAEFNRVYAARFGDWRPARSTVVSALVLPDALVEMDVVAVRRTAG